MFLPTHAAPQRCGLSALDGALAQAGLICDFTSDALVAATRGKWDRLAHFFCLGGACLLLPFQQFRIPPYLAIRVYMFRSASHVLGGAAEP